MFKGKTILITGASRGIGRAIAMRLAREGGNIAICAKTATPHPQLPGTIYDAAKEVESVGGKSLALIVDVRNEDDVQKAVDETVKTFGGIDILVNNASAIQLTPTLQTAMKRYDLMHQVNARGTYLCSKICLPHLQESAKRHGRSHILNISPPLDMQPKWFAHNAAYTAAKYGMSMYAMGMAEKQRENHVCVNALWPRTGVATAAIGMLLGDEGMKSSRKPEVMADAAAIVLSSDATGQFFIDDQLLLDNGSSIESINNYSVVPGAKLTPDFFLDGVEEWLDALAKGKDPRKLKAKL